MRAFSLRDTNKDVTVTISNGFCTYSLVLRCNLYGGGQ